jgi:UDP-N-acetyl-D-mannosaminuronic acid dehydrogenase
MAKFSYDICIVGGLGHIGLPLGILFAKAGKKVILYDINQKVIEPVSKGRMPFWETGAEELLRETIGKTLFINSSKELISQSHFLILTIGTPINSPCPISSIRLQFRIIWIFTRYMTL